MWLETATVWFRLLSHQISYTHWRPTSGAAFGYFVEINNEDATCKLRRRLRQLNSAPRLRPAAQYSMCAWLPRHPLPSCMDERITLVSMARLRDPWFTKLASMLGSVYTVSALRDYAYTYKLNHPNALLVEPMHLQVGARMIYSPEMELCDWSRFIIMIQ